MLVRISQLIHAVRFYKIPCTCIAIIIYNIYNIAIHMHACNNYISDNMEVLRWQKQNAKQLFIRMK